MLRTPLKVPKGGDHHFKSIKFGLLNVRSVGNDSKSGQINDLTTNEALDGLALTDSWLHSDGTFVSVIFISFFTFCAGLQKEKNDMKITDTNVPFQNQNGTGQIRTLNTE